MTSESIRVLVIDDHPLFREALEVALLKSRVNIDNIVSVSSISDALLALESNRFDLALLDLNLSDSQGFEGLSKIRALAPDLSLIVVSATETPQAYSTAKSLGAAGYIPKSTSLPGISKSLQDVLSGGTSFPANAPLDSKAAETAVQKLASLTPAQHRVMTFLSEGLLNKQIAYEMGISEATVKAHMTAIFRKFNANNRTQALLVFRDATQI